MCSDHSSLARRPHFPGNGEALEASFSWEWIWRPRFSGNDLGSFVFLGMARPWRPRFPGNGFGGPVFPGMPLEASSISCRAQMGREHSQDGNSGGLFQTGISAWTKSKPGCFTQGSDGSPPLLGIPRFSRYSHNFHFSGRLFVLPRVWNPEIREIWGLGVLPGGNWELGASLELRSRKRRIPEPPVSADPGAMG